MKLKVSNLILILCLFGIPLSAQDVSAEESVSEISEEAGSVQVDESELSINISEDVVEAAVLAGSTGITGIIRAIVVFLLVLGAIFLLYYLLKKTGGKKFQNQRLIKIISSQAITSNKSLHVVEVGREVFLVGASDNAVSLISRIEDKETIDSLHIEVTGNEPVHKNSFRDILSSIFSRRSGTVPEKNVDNTAQFIKNQGDRLKKL